MEHMDVSTYQLNTIGHCVHSLPQWSERSSYSEETEKIGCYVSDGTHAGQDNILVFFYFENTYLRASIMSFLSTIMDILTLLVYSIKAQPICHSSVVT